VRCEPSPRGRQAAAPAAVAFERLATENEHPSAQTKAMREAAGVQK